MAILRAPNRTRVPRRSFTLIELLVVMGVVALLSALTALGYRSIAKDAKIASGKNTVMAVLDNARAMAMKTNQIVMVVFRPHVDGKEEYVEAVTAKWTGDSGTADTPFGKQVVDRFAPIPGVPTRSLPVGIKVAGPFFGASVNNSANLDDKWITVTHLPAVTDNGQGEAPGEMLGVMFDPSGTTITASSATDAARIFVDFNNDSLQQFGNQVTGVTKLDYYSYLPSDGLPTPPTIGLAQWNGQYFNQEFESDEPYIDVVPYLAVFDDDKAREFYDITRWSTPPSATPGPNRMADYTEFITQNADRIHFNRYTGVAMK
jgi:prepilin-type N-terminal cleavage/methylation domain-containing protein